MNLTPLWRGQGRNPLKSGQGFNKNIFQRRKNGNNVVIPLNRVKVSTKRSTECKIKEMQSRNPLKSGQGFNSTLK